VSVPPTRIVRNLDSPVRPLLDLLTKLTDQGGGRKGDRLKVTRPT